MTVKNYFLLCLCTFFGFFLSGCTISPPAMGVPDLTFAQIKPLNINAAHIKIIDDYIPPQAPPNVDHLFKTPPAQAAQNLLAHMLVATGIRNTLYVHIKDASVVRQNLPVDQGILGLLDRHPSRLYAGRVSLHFEMVDQDTGAVVAHADVAALRNKSLLQGASPADRDTAFFDLTESLMDDLAANIRATAGGMFGQR